MERSRLYRLIRKATSDSILEAFDLVADLDEEEIKERSETDNSTFLHHVVLVATDVHKRYQVNSMYIDLDLDSTSGL